MFAENGIYYYDPSDSCSTSTASQFDSSEISASAGGYDRLKEATRKYGEYAMEMQLKWGTPWEVVLAQMQIESSVGTAGHAVNGADNNWLGITGTGDDGYWEDANGRKWAKFTSIEASIEAWAGTKVLRNGYYDDAFVYLDPDNWDFNSFLTTMISHYAPNSDGNDENGYVQKIITLVNGPIAEVREEEGWPSSEEFAKKNNIRPDGEYGVGSEIKGDMALSNEGKLCYGPSFNSEGAAKMAQLAVWMAWPDPYFVPEPTEEYRQAMIAVMGSDQSLSYYQDCGHFVATVIRYSEIDPEFPLSGTWNMMPYLMNSPLWEEIPNTGSTDDLLPGDVMIVEDGYMSHIMMYVGEYGGEAGNLAQAHYLAGTAHMSDLAMVYGGSGSFANPGSYAPYSIFRLK